MEEVTESYWRVKEKNGPQHDGIIWNLMVVNESYCDGKERNGFHCDGMLWRLMGDNYKYWYVDKQNTLQHGGTLWDGTVWVRTKRYITGQDKMV